MTSIEYLVKEFSAVLGKIKTIHTIRHTLLNLKNGN
jgi:hypothetical protein